MTGIPEFNHPLFLDAERCLVNYLTAEFESGHWDLLKQGFEVINPARNFEGDTTLPRATYMKEELGQALRADVIVLLPGWKDSEGSNLEVSVGRAAGAEFMLAELWGDSWTFTPHDFELGGVRLFASGATRDTEHGKYDFEAFLSPIVLEAFAGYMHKHRERNDGSLRDGDDWQKGMPYDVYIKSMWRHFMSVWKYHRGYDCDVIDPIESLMALMFNVQGYAYELLRNL